MPVRTALFAIAFALSIAAARLTVLPETGLALFWPPAGIAALWGLYAATRREVILVGGLVAVIATLGNAVTGFPLAAAVFLGVANAVIGVGVRGAMSWDRRRCDGGAAGRNTLESLVDFYRLLAATMLAVTASSAFGMLGLLVAGLPVTGSSLTGWLIRNAAAVIVIAAPGLTMRAGVGLVTRRLVAEGLTMVLATAGVLWFVFGPGQNLPLGFLPFALVFWSGLRLPLPLAAVQGLLVALGSLVLVLVLAHGVRSGPFDRIASDFAAAASIQTYMLMAVGLAIMVATVQRERDQLLREVADSASYASLHAQDLRVITETIPDGILVINRRGDILMHNEAAARWVASGESGDSVLVDGVSRPLSETLVERYLDGSPIPTEERPFVRALAGETVRGALVITDDPDLEEPRIVAVDAVPMLDTGVYGLPDRVLLVFRDVSDDHARIRALEAERERTERLISDAPHGVAVLDLDGRVLQVNDSLASLAGRTVEELVGMRFEDLSPTHRQKMRVYLERTLAVPGELLVGDWTIESAVAEDAHVSLTSRVLTASDEADEVILVNVVDFSERRRYEERLTYLADHDALTGLPNRRRFDEVLDEHLRQCQRRGATGALLLVDLDHFKEVNDTMGHDAGDQLIVSTASLLRDNLRVSDLVARLGGDEFAVLLPDADLAGAEAVAEALVQRVRAHCSRLEGVKRRVTASVGVITFAAAAQQSVDPLALADMLLYDAKDAGRNRYAVLDASGTQQPRSGARLEWMSRIESAIEHDKFELYLQPILDVRSNRVVAAEALLRLVDRGHPVAPGRFVHIAERAGLAPDLDRWVVRNAVAMLSRLHHFAPELTLEINLSGHSIGDASVEHEFVEALRRHDVAPHKIVVEATETAAVADVAAARAFSQRLGAMGTRVAIDDFGAGFGSFYYLKHLPFDIVKIDGEFVVGAHTSAVDRAILRSIVGVARNLGKETVAEFVAEEAVLEVVRELGVDYAQGYLIGEPVPFDVFVERHLAGGSSPWTTAGPSRAGSQHALMVGGDV